MPDGESSEFLRLLSETGAYLMEGGSGIIGLVRANDSVLDVPPDVLKDFIKHRYVIKGNTPDDVTIYTISNRGRKAAAK